LINDRNAIPPLNASRAGQGSDRDVPFCWFNENGSKIGNIDHLNCSEPALLWASLTVGAPYLAIVIRDLRDAPAFALHKWFAIRSVLDFQNGEIHMREAFKLLDPSEKGALSYWTGMIFAKLAAEQVLAAPWMAHARLLQKVGLLQINPPNTKSLPDLIGCTSRAESGIDWHIVEAKGLQRYPSPNRRQSYKNQVGVIETISGEKPATRNYCIANIRSPFSAELHDPENISEKSIDADINPLDLQKYYYRPFLDLFSDAEDGSNVMISKHFVLKKLLCDPIHKERCCVGIAREVFDQVKEWGIKEQAGSGEENKPLKNIDVSELSKDEIFEYGDAYIGSDGIFVQLLREKAW